MARVADYLASIGFYWPMVSAQDHGRLAPLHELDASFGNTVKHVQTETVMGERPARYAVRMAEAALADQQSDLDVAKAKAELARARAEASVALLIQQGVVAERIRSRAEIGASDTAAAQSVSFVVGERPY